MFLLKLLKLKIEVRLSDQLPFPLYVILFVVDGLLIKLLVIVIIIQILILIVVGHDWLASLPNACYQLSSYPFVFRWRLRPKPRNSMGGSNDTGAFSISDWREVSHIV